jgi:hypothetical protein
LKLAKEYNGAICTIDFNLNKVAQVEGIVVLNVNDLAKTLRMAYLPGEKIKLELTQKGNDQHQAVGHLDDGTMVVVEHASSQIGKVVEIEFIRGLQTAAGKMMFARLVGSGDRDQAKKPLQTVKALIPRVRQPRQKTERTERVKTQPQDQTLEATQEVSIASEVSNTPSLPTRGRRPQQSRYSSSTPQVQQTAQPSQTPEAEKAVVAQRNNNGRQSNRRRTPEDSLFELLDKQE